MGRRSLLVVAAASVLVLAACNKNSSSSTTGGGGASPSSSGTAQISTAQVSGVGTVLVNPAGFTLYHLKTESENNIKCTGPCAQTWPPCASTRRLQTARPMPAPEASCEVRLER